MVRYTGIGELDEILNRLEQTQSRDDHEAIQFELCELAPKYVEEIAKLYEAKVLYSPPLVRCLVGETKTSAFALFARALTDKDQYTRWEAARGLRRFSSRRASKLLVAALKDRSHLVKGVAIAAMSKFLDPDAVPQLEKIVQSKHLQAKAPGMVREAQKALDKCRRGT